MFKKLFCFLGLHAYRCTGRKMHKDGSITVYSKCAKCGKTTKYEYNPNAKHACCCGSGKEEGHCHCNMG